MKNYFIIHRKPSFVIIEESTLSEMQIIWLHQELQQSSIADKEIRKPVAHAHVSCM
jgi:hypothetical protein